MLRLTWVIVWISVCCWGWSQPAPISRLQQPLEFDGKVDDPAWRSIMPLDLTVHIPNYRGEPSEYTEIRLAYDDEYLYISGVMLDSEPHLILANSKKRDALIGTTEWFGLVIDSYNDKQNALAFFTTPTSLRLDGAVSNDALGDDPMNFNWNNFWDAASTRDDNGWYSEIRVPFSSLAFQPEDGNVTLGISTWRYIARKGEVQMHPDIPPDFGDWSAWRPSMMREFTLSQVEAKKPFYITPYVLGAYENTHLLSDDESHYVKDDDFDFEAGLDLKYGISNSWTLDASVNTDFAQVEADDQQVNLTRFNLFFPEKRLFFQERAGIFDYNFGRQDKLFYSRRIGIYDGDPIRIYGGARVVGRSGPWDVGFLSMQTESVDTVFSQNHSVFRVKRQIINDVSSVGMILTNQMDFQGIYNTTYGVDATINVFRDDFLSLRWAQTIENDRDYKLASLDPTKFWISLGSRNERGFTYGASFSRRGIDYNPVLGFEVRENFTRFGMRTGYNWFLDNDASIFSHGPEIGGATHWTNRNGSLESSRYRIGYGVRFKNTAAVEVNFNPQYEALIEEFEIGDEVSLPVGEYLFYGISLQGNTPQTKTISATMQAGIGQFYDGSRKSIQFEPQWNVSSSLELSAFYQFNNINFNERGQKINIHLARLKGLVMFSTKFSLSAFLQYNSLDKVFAGNIRLRYNPKEGNDLFIVYNDNVNSDLEREFPVLPRSNIRTFIIKYSYTFRP